MIERSITKWLCPNFTDSDFDSTTYWLEFQYASKRSYGRTCEHFKNGVVTSHNKVDFWRRNDGIFYKNHPTVASNKKIAKRIYDYLKNKSIL